MKFARMLAALAASVGFLAASASAQVVISQLYGGGQSTGAPYNADYVELYNKGPGTADLTGWSVQYAAAVGTTWSRRDLSGSIPANRYFLVQMSTTGAAGAALPTPDVAGTGIAMSATTGKVALVNNQTTLSGACPSFGAAGIVDFIGYGTANCFEGAGIGAAPTITTAVFRLNGGCTDSNNNNLDTNVAAPNPRNSASDAGPTCSSDADLSLTASASPNPAYVGSDTVTYTLGVNNIGASSANNCMISFPMPAGLTGFASVPAGAPNGPNYEINLGTISANASVNVTVTATPTGDATITANFSVSTTSTEVTNANNSASANHRTYLAASSVAIKISQVYPGGGSASAAASYNRDYVELFNAGGQPFTLDGRSIQYQSETGTTWTSVVLPNFTLNPGQYYLVALGTTGTGGAPLPATDFASTSNSLANTAGKVALVNGSAALTTGCNASGPLVIDFVGWEGVACFEGSGAAPWTSGDLVNVIYRKADGCTDTNNNATDLKVTRPAPRNSTTTVTCGTPKADLVLTASVTPDCQVLPGAGALTMIITCANAGDLAAANSQATITFPASLTPTNAVTGTGSALISSNTVTWTIGSVGIGAAPTLTITADVSSAIGNAVVTGTASTTSLELATGDNAFSHANYIPADYGTNLLQVIATSVPTASLAKRTMTSATGGTVNIVGVGQVETFSRLYRSPDGTKFAVLIDTDGHSFTGDQLCIVTVGPNPTITAIADTGGTFLVNGAAITSFDRVLAINDAGQVAFSGARSSLGTAADDFVALYTPGSPGTITAIAEESAAAPGLVDGATIGTTSIVQGLTNNGKVLFVASLAGTAVTANNQYLCLSDGTTHTVIARKGVDFPGSNFAELLTGTWLAMSTSGTDRSANITGDGAHTMLSGTLSTGNTARDDSLVYDGFIMAQEGAIIPGSGFGAAVSSFNFNYLDPDNHWFALGSNTGGQDFALRDGVVIARTGDLIHSGATESFSDTSPLNPGGAGFAQCFFQAHGFGSNWIVGGISNGPDAWANAVIVTADRVVMREGDPIDVNGNGLNDDNAAAHILRDDRMMVGADGAVYAVLQTRARNICSGIVDIGNTLVRIPPPGPAACSIADIATEGNPDLQAGPDGFITGVDADAFFEAYFKLTQRPDNTFIADIVGDLGIGPPNGFVEGVDADAFVIAFFVGC